MQLSTTADGQNLAPLEMAKKLQQMIHQQMRNQKESSLPTIIFEQAMLVWGENLN